MMYATRTIAYALILATALLSVAGTALSQPSYTINYQGKLTDTTGKAVADASYDMEFRLYTVASGGSAIWTETRTGGNQVAVTNGLFSVMLGDVSALTSVDFNQTLYLGVNIDSDGEMTPRKILGTVPSAFEAQQLGGVASTSFLRSDQADTASGLISFTSGLVSSASSTITELTSSTSTVTNLVINGESFTDITGTGLTNASGVLTLDATGDWTGTFDGQEGAWYIANSFSTTSADGWEATQISRSADDLSNNSIQDLSDVGAITENTGDLFYWNGSAWSDIATSSLAINTDDLIEGASNLFSQWTTSGSNIYYTTGSVGIGTSTPDRELVIDGDLQITGGIYDNNNEAGTAGQILSSTNGGLDWVSTSTLGFGSGDGTVTSVAASVPTGWTVTGSPITDSGTLAFAYDTGYGAVLVASSTNWTTFYDTPSTRITAGTDLSWSGNTLNFNNSSGYITGLSTGDTIGSATQGSVFFAGASGVLEQDNANFFFDDTNNRLGIGTSTPEGSISVDGLASGDLGLVLQTNYTGDIADGDVLRIRDGLGRDLVLFGADADGGQFRVQRFNETAYIEANTLFGGANFRMQRGGTGNDIGLNLITDGGTTWTLGAWGTDATDTLSITTGGLSGTKRFSITNTGNVGIGTTSPYAKLSVDGDIAFTGGIYDANNTLGTNGYVLQTDGTNATWVATSSLGIAGGGGTVTSVAASVPTGWTVTGSPITDSGTLAFAYDTGYGPVLTASSTNWTTFYDTPSTRISAGTGLSWSGNTLNAEVQSSDLSSYGSDNQIPYTNAGGTNFDYSSAFTFDGSTLITSVDNVGYAASFINDGNNANREGILIRAGSDDLGTGNVTFVDFQDGDGTAVGAFANVGDFLDLSGSTGLTLAGGTLFVDGSSFIVGTGIEAISGTAGSPAFYFSDDTDTGIFRSGSNFAITTAGSERVTVNLSGNVGIGTTSPYAKLSVDGDIAFTGGIYDANNTLGTNGYVLQTDGTNATWVATSSLGIAGGGGTVTSVAASVPTGWTVTGSPITDSGTLAFAYDTGYGAVLTASSTNWNSFYDTPSSRITAGSNLSWAGNTLNVLTTGDWTGTFDGQEGSYYLDLANSTGDTDDLTEGTTNLFSQWDNATGGINYAGGNVGIGTTTPDTILSIKDTAPTVKIGDDSTNVTLDDVIGELAFASDDPSGSLAGAVRASLRAISESSSGNASGLAFLTNTGAAATERMRLTNLGRLGLGTSTPSSQLHLYGGNVADGQINITANSSGSTYGIDFNHSSAGRKGFIGLRGGSSSAPTPATPYSYYVWAQDASAPMIFGTNNTERIRILSGGNVGIGTTTPGNLLTVDGTLQIGNSLTLSDNGATDAITGGSHLLFTASASTGDIRFENGGGNLLYLEGFTRNVGIGTTSPYAKLSVDGDIAFTGGIYDANNTLGTAGQVLQTDGTNATWVATSTLGVGGLSSSDIDTSAELAAILTDETGTAGSVVFSADPTFTGTVNTAAITATGDITTDTLTSTGNLKLAGNNNVVVHLDDDNNSAQSFIIFDGADSNVFQVNELGQVLTGTWQGTAIGDAYLTKTGDWTGTFDGQEGSYYLDLANSTGDTDDITEGTTNLFSQWSTSGSDVYYNTGNVGIGTSTPSARLTVLPANVTDGVVVREADDGFDAVRIEGSNAAGSIKTYLGGVLQNEIAQQVVFNENSGLNNDFRIESNNDTDMFFMDSGEDAIGIGYGATDLVGTTGSLLVNGNVGIGTTTPRRRFSVYSTEQVVAETVGDNVTAAYFDVVNWNTSGDVATRYFGNGLTRFTTGYDASLNGYGINIGSSLDDTPNLFVSSSNGNVGIGTSTPAVDLHLAGTGELLRLQSSDSAPILRFTNSGASDFSSLGQVSGGLALSAAATPTGNEHILIANSGNVGIGDTSPASLFTVGNGDLFQVNSSGDIVTQSVGVDALESEDFGDFTCNGTTCTLDATYLSTASIDTSAELAAILTDETGTAGSVVFSASPTLTGTLTAAAANFSSNVGIGTSTPEYLLTLQRNESGSAGAGNSQLTLISGSGGNINTGYRVGGIDFISNDLNVLNTVARIEAVASGNHSGSNFDTDLVFSATTGDTPVEYMRIDKDGNVGIGTTTPYANLTVVGASGSPINVASFLNDTIADGGYVNIDLGNVPGEGASGGYAAIQAGRFSSTDRGLRLIGRGQDVNTDSAYININGNNSGGITFFTSTTPTADGTQRMVIDGAGNVGIGTTSPNEILEIHDDNAVVRINDNSAGGSQYIAGVELDTTAGTGFIGFDNQNYTNSGANDLVFSNARFGADFIFYGNAGAELMRLDSGGNLGIGTTTPAEELSVVGQVDITAAGNGAAANRLLELRNTNNTANAYANLSISAGTTGNMLELGHYAAGATTPTHMGLAAANYAWIEADILSNGLMLGTEGADPILFGTQDTERMRITSAGNVGIGTTTPGAPLALDRDGLAFTGVGTGSFEISGSGDRMISFDNNGSFRGAIGSENSDASMRIYHSGDPTTAAVIVDASGNTSFTGNLDADSGLDVTGNITVTGTVDGKDISTLLASTDIDTSAELAAILTDETGSGSVVFSNSPTFNTSVLLNSGAELDFAEATEDKAMWWGTTYVTGVESNALYWEAPATTGNFRWYTGGNDGGTSDIMQLSDSALDVEVNLDANAGLDVTGNITVTGTVDGKDIATNAAMLNEAETISALWDFTGDSIRTARGINGRYSPVSGNGSFGSTIWSIGVSFDGTASGNTYAPTSVYGLSWLRSSNANADANVGEGLYVYQNGSYQGGIGSTGIETTGTLTVAGNSSLSTITSGTWNGTAIGDTYITKTGDWTGTLDGIDGANFLRSDTADSAAGLITFDAGITIGASDVITHNTNSTRDKIRLWNSDVYAIGMQNAFTFGGLGADYAMTFQMNDDVDRGFWWGDVTHGQGNGAMALTTDGELTVAKAMRLGYGESDTTSPGATYALDVSGSTYIAGDLEVRDATPILTIGTTGNSAGAIYLGNSAHGIARNYSGANDVGFYTTSGDLFLSTTGSGVTSQFTLQNTGDVGIGEANPTRRLEVFETVADDQFRISYDATRYADFQVTSVGDLVIDAQGGDITAPDENLYVCDGGSCASTSGVAGGNITAERAITSEEQTVTAGTGLTINWDNGNQQYIQLTANTTITGFSNATNGQTLRLVICQDGTGGRTLGWGALAIEWAGGTEPTETTTANRCDVYSFIQSTGGILGASSLNHF